MKTWTELLGKYDSKIHFIDYRFIVCIGPDNQRKVIWAFDTPLQAQESYLAWTKGE